MPQALRSHAACVWTYWTRCAQNETNRLYVSRLLWLLTMRDFGRSQIIFDPRQLYLHESAEATRFDPFIFLWQFALHILGGPLGSLLLLMARRSDGIANGTSQGALQAPGTGRRIPTSVATGR